MKGGCFIGEGGSADVFRGKRSGDIKWLHLNNFY